MMATKDGATLIDFMPLPGIAFARTPAAAVAIGLTAQEGINHPLG
jgi:hypothetical protein